jgi:hypothetical protein
MSTFARSWVLLVAAALLAAPLSGCGSNAAAGSGVSAIYTVPSSLDQLSQETFFDHPWPSDLRLESGSPRLTGYYNPLSLPILDAYVESISGLIDGFSPAGAGYLRFTDAIDPRSLPHTPHDGLDPGASVQLLDIDPTSPDHGQRQLASLKWRAPAGVYFVSNTLAFMPVIGFPLRPHTRYALVVTDALEAASGGHVIQSSTVAKLVGAQPPDAATRDASATLSPAVMEIEKAGISRARIVHLAVFTTSNPTAELITVRDGVFASAPAPQADPNQWKLAFEGASFAEYQGSYGPSPNYQQGTLPFVNYGDGGGFAMTNGLPVVQSTFNLRFSLTVPDASACPMPPTGYPIVLYAHGTGGDWRSYLEDGTGVILAKHCLATMGVDQIFQGVRPGSMPMATEGQIGLVFYNVQNPVAARTNGRQSAIDEVQRARLFTDSNMVVPASVSATGSDIRFDASKLMFFGHSQGGLNGPLFTAIDATARGAVFSGSGAVIAVGLLDKTEPQPAVSGLVRTLLGLNETTADELDVFHPAISLFQDIIDVVDPINYARLQALEPRMGASPKSIYMTEGINPDGTGDSYAPPPGIEAHALSMGLPLQLPDEHAIAQLAWGGPKPTTVPSSGLSGNLASGAASGVLAQWAVPNGHDGHFVVFDVPAAREQAAQFLQNLAANPQGLVPQP